MTSIVRAAMPADAPAIGEVRDASWRATYERLLPPGVLDGGNSARWAEQRAEQLRSGSLSAFVAEVDGAVRGYAFYGPCRDEDLPDYGEVYAIYVHPDEWSTGLGRTLLAAAVGTLGARVALWVLTDNRRARRFYEIAGFVADGASKLADLPGDTQLPEVRYRLR